MKHTQKDKVLGPAGGGRSLLCGMEGLERERLTSRIERQAFSEASLILGCLPHGVGNQIQPSQPFSLGYTKLDF